MANNFGTWQPYTGDFHTINEKWGCYEYVVHLASQVMKMHQGLVITSGKYGHPMMATGGGISDHYLGQGIDLSGFGSNGGYLKVAKTLVGHPYLKYTIGDNQWNKHNDGNFVTFPWGGHMNHVHLSFKSPAECEKANKSGNFEIGQSFSSDDNTSAATTEMSDDTASTLKKVFAQGVKFLLLLGAFILMVLFFMRAFPVVGSVATDVIPATKGLKVAKKLIK